jgi:prepilin-type N-terminal cleavage/methylation domain-containing protein
MHRTRQDHLRAGFSVLELVIVIVIMGLMAAAAVPAFSRSLKASRTARAAGVIQADIELAYSYAARQRKPVRIAYNSSTLTYTVTDRAAGTTLITRTLGSGSEWTLDAVTWSATPIDVYPGGFSSGTLSITITGGTASTTITMTRAGLVRLS